MKALHQSQLSLLLPHPSLLQHLQFNQGLDTLLLHHMLLLGQLQWEPLLHPIMPGISTLLISNSIINSTMRNTIRAITLHLQLVQCLRISTSTSITIISTTTIPRHRATMAMGIIKHHHQPMDTQCRPLRCILQHLLPLISCHQHQVITLWTSTARREWERWATIIIKRNSE
jgi:hypothetical protein